MTIRQNNALNRSHVIFGTQAGQEFFKESDCNDNMFLFLRN